MPVGGLTEFLYNSNTGYIAELPTLIARVELSSGLGWHGPFDSKAEAVTYYNTNKAKNPGWKAPTGSVKQTIDNAGSSAGDVVTNKLGLSNENITAWMVRIGEILLGIVLVGVGIAKLTGTTNVVAKAVKARI